MNNKPRIVEVWLEFEEWSEKQDDNPRDEAFIMEIVLSDRRKFALNVWTYAHIETARSKPGLESSELHGKYVVGPDIFVEKMDRELLEKVAQDLLDTGELDAKQGWEDV